MLACTTSTSGGKATRTESSTRDIGDSSRMTSLVRSLASTFWFSTSRLTSLRPTHMEMNRPDTDACTAPYAIHASKPSSTHSGLAILPCSISKGRKTMRVSTESRTTLKAL